MYILINGKLIKEENAAINPNSQGFLYGYGLFETIKFENKRIYFLREHVDRFKDGCGKLRLNIDFDINKLEDYCNKVVEANHMLSGALKILFARGSDKNYLIISARENKYTKEDYMKGFKVFFTDIKRNPYSILTYIKSNNYLENLIARKQALDTGYDEVLFENTEGYLCEGAISNIFFIRNSIIYTPAIECGILPGIVRNKIIDTAIALNLPIKVGRYIKEDVMQADEVFVTNSLMGIMPVSEINNKKLCLNKNSVTKELKQAYNNYLSAGK